MPSTIEPNQDRIEGVVDVGGSLSLEGRDMGATLGYDESARAGGAQAARERAPHQRDEAQRAALLEQAREEKKTAQQARLTSIREQQASLVRWVSAKRAEAGRILSEVRLAAAEILTPAEARREPAVAWTAATETLTPAGARREPTEARPAATETLTPAEARREPTEAATGAEKAASAKAAMDKPTRPPDRLNEQFAVTSAAFVQEPGEPASFIVGSSH